MQTPSRRVSSVRRPPRPVLVAALAGALCLGGCGPRRNSAASYSTPGEDGVAAATVARAGGSAVDDSVAHYNAGRYAQALAAASGEMQRYRGRDRDISALTAGLSAHALNQNAEARRWLEPLRENRDPQIAGRAQATLGLIAQREHDNVRAADLLGAASATLVGDEGARAAIQAGHSLTELGRYDQARQRYMAAAGLATTERVRQHAHNLAEPGPFALQVGVYGSRPNAAKRVKEITQQSTRLGFGLPLVWQVTAQGKPAYSVRVGTFPNRQAAAMAKDRLGMQAVVVAAMQ